MNVPMCLDCKVYTIHENEDYICPSCGAHVFGPILDDNEIMQEVNRVETLTPFENALVATITQVRYDAEKEYEKLKYLERSYAIIESRLIGRAQNLQEQIDALSKAYQDSLLLHKQEAGIGKHLTDEVKHLRQIADDWDIMVKTMAAKTWKLEEQLAHIQVANLSYLRMTKKEHGFCYSCGTSQDNCVNLNYGSDEIELCERHFTQLWMAVEGLMGWKYPTS